MGQEYLLLRRAVVPRAPSLHSSLQFIGSFHHPRIIRLHSNLGLLLCNLHPRTCRGFRALSHRDHHLLHHNHCVSCRKDTSHTRLIAHRVHDLDVSTHRWFYRPNT